MTEQSKKTPGEELYLVHLRRLAEAKKADLEDEEDDDHDYPQQRKRSRSIGDELFSVFLKRSEGCDPDYDIDPEKGETTLNDNVSGKNDHFVGNNNKSLDKPSITKKGAAELKHKKSIDSVDTKLNLSTSSGRWLRNRIIPTN